MTREEAIESFKHSNEQAKVRLEVEKMRMDSGEIKELEFYIERNEIAIKALEQEPKTEAVKTAIIQELKDHFIEPEDAGLTIKGEYWLAREVLAIIEETEPKTGHWIRQDNTKEPLYGWYFCSECNSVIGDKTKFCSNCGCRMVEPQESEDEG